MTTDDEAKNTALETLSADEKVSEMLDGFRLIPDIATLDSLDETSRNALQREITIRVERFCNAPDNEIGITEQGGLMWASCPAGKLERGDTHLAPHVHVFCDELLNNDLAERVYRRLSIWVLSQITRHMAPILQLQADETISPSAVNLAMHLIRELGVIPRSVVATEVKNLPQEHRASLRKHDIRFGQFTIFIPQMLKPSATKWRLILLSLHESASEIPLPPPAGHVTFPLADTTGDTLYLTRAGYRRCGNRALRVDMLERLANMIRPLDAENGFEASAEILSITGTTLDQLAQILESLGYQAEKRERPRLSRKTISPKKPSQPNSDQADSTQADSAIEGKSEEIQLSSAQPEVCDVDPGVKASADPVPLELSSPLPEEPLDKTETVIGTESFYIFRRIRHPRAGGRPKHYPQRHSSPRGEADFANEDNSQGERDFPERGRHQPGLPQHNRPFLPKKFPPYKPAHPEDRDAHPSNFRQAGRSALPAQDKRHDTKLRSPLQKSPVKINPDSPFAILQQLRDKI